MVWWGGPYEDMYGRKMYIGYYGDEMAKREDANG